MGDIDFEDMESMKEKMGWLSDFMNIESEKSWDKARNMKIETRVALVCFIF